MKYLYILCFTTLPFLAGYADTIYVIRDSIYADSLYGNFATQYPEEAKGYPDSAFASFSGGALLDLAFRAYGGTTLRTMLKGGQVLVWGQRHSESDSSAAKVIFYKTDKFGNPQYESKPYYVVDGLNTITLDTHYTYMEFSLTENNEPGDTIPGSKGYLLDAVLLLQNRDSVVTTGAVGRFAEDGLGIITNYPNPFSATQQTMLRIYTDHYGDALLNIYDISGREVKSMLLGPLEPGDHAIPVSVPQAQTYLVQLIIDGIPVGGVHRITAR